MWMTVRYGRMSRRTYGAAGAQLCGYWHLTAAGATGCEEEDRERVWIVMRGVALVAMLSRRRLAGALGGTMLLYLGSVWLLWGR
jgi:hypothetical protein